MNLKLLMEVRVLPFDVPDFVTVETQAGKRQDGFIPVHTIPLCDLSPEQLELLCDRFRADCIVKAGHPIVPDPRQ